MCDLLNGDASPIEFRDREHISLFLSGSLEGGSIDDAAEAFGVVIRAYGVDKMARESGLSVEHLARSFGDRGDPDLSTVLAVMKVLDILLTTRVKDEREGD
ncbi:transcriptional regulator [Pseudomonas chlororaphis]|nr:transcriptional regulator [Pseudomonas chlororaphis]